MTLLNGSTVKAADGGQRALGRIMDAVILFLGFIGFYLILIVGIIGTSETTFNTDTGEFETSGLGGFGLIFFSNFLVLALLLLYETAFVATRGQTPGKMIIGTKIVNEASGEPIGWGPAFMRALLPAIGYMICLILAVGVYLTAFLDKSGRLQGWHDRLGHDLVISLK
ncbi:MAG: RDD family protein [Acidimicrobiales bacterium]